MEKTNQENNTDRCRGCNQKMQTLFGTGRSMICKNPNCPYDKNKDWKDPCGFDLIEIGSPQDKDEITVPVQLDLTDYMD